MCVSFNPETIYKNAFFNEETRTVVPKLLKSNIVDFCSILREEISKNVLVDVKYKYVYFEFDKRTLSSFYDAYFGIFNEIGEEIFLSAEITEKDIQALNTVYDDVAQNALKATRERFVSLIGTSRR